MTLKLVPTDWSLVHEHHKQAGLPQAHAMTDSLEVAVCGLKSRAKLIFGACEVVPYGSALGLLVPLDEHGHIVIFEVAGLWYIATTHDHRSVEDPQFVPQPCGQPVTSLSDVLSHVLDSQNTPHAAHHPTE